jgi:hypothetical protein
VSDAGVQGMIPWQGCSRRRAVGLVGAAGLAIWLGFVGLPVRVAEEVVKRGGFYFMALTVAWWVVALARAFRRRRLPPAAPTRAAFPPGRRLVLGVVIGGLTLMAIQSEPYRGKILNDEFVLQSTAYNLHHFRDVATMVRGYEVEGTFISTDNYLDKRPYFYPFLVSLLHDFTGYRPANAFVLNSVLYAAALGLIYAVGQALAGWRGGLLAALLAGSLPLLGQNATGSGMELLNVVMIVGTLWLGARYLADPEEAGLEAFLLSVVLLAQSRYESALYVFAAAAVVVWGWWAVRRVILPWSALAAPMLLLPVALQQRVVANSPLLWELDEARKVRFSIDYLPANVRGALAFLFNGNAERANSLLLSAAGLAAVQGLALLVAWRWRTWRRRAPAEVALACFGGVILANTGLVMFYYWASFDDPMASRFSLPWLLLMVFAIVVVARWLDRRLPATTLLLALAAGWAVPEAAAKFGHHYYSHLGNDEIAWHHRWVNARPSARRLVISNRTSLSWLLEETPAILLDRARLVADRLQHQLTQPLFDEILVIQALRPTSAEGDFQLPEEEALPDFFRTELLAEKRFGTRLCRVSRLVAVELPVGWEPPLGKGKEAAGKTAGTER